MEINKYQELANKIINPKIKQEDLLVNSVMGLCGESGEVIDLVKKHLFQGHPLDKEHLIRELGDVAWYLAEAAKALDVTLEEIFMSNIKKLEMRYPNGFSPEMSIHRDIKDI